MSELNPPQGAFQVTRAGGASGALLARNLTALNQLAQRYVPGAPKISVVDFHLASGHGSVIVMATATGDQSFSGIGQLVVVYGLTGNEAWLRDLMAVEGAAHKEILRELVIALVLAAGRRESITKLRAEISSTQAALTEVLHQLGFRIELRGTDTIIVSLDLQQFEPPQNGTRA